ETNISRKEGENEGKRFYKCPIDSDTTCNDTLNTKGFWSVCTQSCIYKTNSCGTFGCTNLMA
uniref:GRF-type domain-containing protein n=1 Tax=Triticum urartu TaxID=4572 RepID=A0A8R7PTG4_TRIUA